MRRTARLHLPLALAASLAISLGGPLPAATAAPAPAAGTGSTTPTLGEAFGPSSASQIGLAEHLKTRGAIFYGAFWCQHCFRQKLLFGQQAGNALPYVECAKDEAGEKACEAAGVKAYPTWVMGKERLEGVQTLQELATWSQYVGPSDFGSQSLKKGS